MSDRARPHTPARRDAALRRLRTVNRSLIAVALAGAAVLTDVAAHAFPGRTIKRVAGDTVAASPAASISSSTTVHHHHHRPKVAALRPPARGLAWWIASAANSLPVPLSPVMNTLARLAATLSTVR